MKHPLSHKNTNNVVQDTTICTLNVTQVSNRRLA